MKIVDVVQIGLLDENPFDGEQMSLVLHHRSHSNWTLVSAFKIKHLLLMQIQIIEQRILVEVLVDQILDRLVRLISLALKHLRLPYLAKLIQTHYLFRLP